MVKAENQESAKIADLYKLPKDILIYLISVIRDETIKECKKERQEYLIKRLSDFDIIQCPECSYFTKEYLDNSMECEICSYRCCSSCSHEKIKHVKTWNLSGCWMCPNCIKTYCHNCMSRVEIGESMNENEVKLCAYCLKREERENM